MPINIKGHKLVDAATTTATGSTPQENFVAGVKKQLSNLQKVKGERNWFKPLAEGGYETDVRYGTFSLLDGKRIQVAGKKELAALYKDLQAQGLDGDFDAEIQICSDKIAATRKSRERA